MQVDGSRLPASAHLSLSLFGEFRLCADNTNVTPRGRKARALLAYLAVADRGTASRQRVAGLLWSDRGEAQARGSLRQVLAELRGGVIGDRGALVVSREAIDLAPGSVVSDVASMARAAAGAEIAALAEQIDHVRGMFLDDLQDLSPGFDEWLLTERVLQHDRLVTAALAAIGTTLGWADPVSVHVILSALDRLDPGNEHIARLGLLANSRRATPSRSTGVTGGWSTNWRASSGPSRRTQPVSCSTGDAEALDEIGMGLCCLGDLDAAEPAMQRAFLLNPFAPPDYHADYAVLLALAERARAAEEHFEVSGGSDLLYQAVRLANIWSLVGNGEPTGAIADDFGCDFASIWQPAAAPRVADVLQWIDDSFFLKQAEHRRFLHDGISAALSTCDVIDRGNRV